MTKTLLPLAGLEDVLRYEPDTGKFFWTVVRWRKIRVGDPAGHLNKKGYIEIRYNYKTYLAHRVAWYLHTGEDPHSMGLDHVNGDRADNRISNLRLANPTQNARNMRKRRNTTSTYKGVSWHEKSDKWQAQIRVDGRSMYLGYFNSQLDAHLAYCKAAAEHHGEFANFG
jgi:hypothetical protein